MHFMPLWLPIWTLSTLALDCLGVLAITFYLPATATDPPTKVTDSRVTFFILTLATWTGPGVVYACSVILSFLVHSRRLQFHNLLLERMASFDFRNAKCKLESDRQGRVEGKKSMRNRSLPINLVQSSRPPKAHLDILTFASMIHWVPTSERNHHSMAPPTSVTFVKMLP